MTITVLVARTLSKNGRVFLVDRLVNEALADSVNHLLVVGFYLINTGYVLLVLKTSNLPSTLLDSIEYLSGKLGWVLIVVGGMHFFNMYVISRWARGRKTNSSADKS